VLYDEIDLPTGKIQKKIGWSAAGHNGIKSILQHLENNNTFTKIRIWVDRPSTKEEVVDWVLWDFSKAELTEIDNRQELIFWYINEFIEN
jgi:PTH1 family peptidyl-tRNA hydrolase